MSAEGHSGGAHSILVVTTAPRSGFSTLTATAWVWFPAREGVLAATTSPNLFLGGYAALEQLLGFSSELRSSQCVGLDQGRMNFEGWQQPPVLPLPSGQAAACGGV